MGHVRVVGVMTIGRAYALGALIVITMATLRVVLGW